ncbi:MAG: alpha-glucosidase MalA [Candidatus Parvarchaeum sp.]|nr:glycoside hydrolase family 31 protein [Candidatus Parvarchaeota archaeon]MCW1295205.1 alpha-glucosidase MalA [Candidatus Parvarchaeum tengchongense]MCW1299313.1 alpha-glucosidase MalA [Candidatus Parvarchaeum tengchongense]
MQIKCKQSNGIHYININYYNPVVKFNLPKDYTEDIHSNTIDITGEKFSFYESEDKIILSKDLDIKEHILGLGENAFKLDKRRSRLTMWNTDAHDYTPNTDKMYISIPFFISVKEKNKLGVFINYPGKIDFDFGIKEYDKTIIEIFNKSAEIFIIEGQSLKEILNKFLSVTGKPFKIPEWALGHSISRYSYFPQKTVINVLKEYKKYSRVDTIYLDIDYMDKYKIFQWNRSYFQNPKKMIKEIHKMKTKIVTIVDPAIRIEQEYETFINGIGHYCERESGEIYTSKMWAGNCVFPDFFNEKTRNWWSSKIKKWVSDYSIDGIWLDMNEPTVFNLSKTFDSDVIHKINNNYYLKHEKVHNAYAYFEAMATYKGIKNGFILSRSGYAGIQKYAAIWSGDSVSSWEDMRLQIPIMLNLSLSGVPYVGCDLGGFNGRNEPDLLVAYYRMAVFFPIFRNHKNKLENDQEIYILKDKDRESIKKAIELRYLFMSYIKDLALLSHKKGSPIIRPLFYEFEDDENTYQINDEYMLGSHLLYAPQLENKIEEREVYLPGGKWLDLNNKKEFLGPCYIKSNDEFPIFIRKGTNIELTNGKKIVY